MKAIPFSLFVQFFPAHSFLQPVKLEIIMEITGDLTGQKVTWNLMVIISHTEHLSK